MPAIPYFSPIDMNRNEVQNFVVHNLASAPSSPVKGLPYFDTVLNVFRVWNGTAWIDLTAAGSNPVTKAVASGATGRMQISAAADRTIQDWAAGSAGIVKTDTNGGVSVATAGTDYTSPAGAESLTNKTFNASSNTVSNLTTSMFAANVVDTDTALTANSDTRLVSQKAAKAYIDNKVVNGVNMMGTIDASANPNFPAAAKGDFYKISVAGKIGGASGPNVEAGDSIVAVTANIGGTNAAVGASWDIIQNNVDQASTTVIGLVALATQAEAEAKSNTVKAVVPADLVNFPIKKIFTLTGDNSTVTFACAHNLNTTRVLVGVQNSSGEHVVVYTKATTVNNVNVVFTVAPGVGITYEVTIIG